MEPAAPEAQNILRSRRFSGPVSFHHQPFVRRINAPLRPVIFGNGPPSSSPPPHGAHGSSPSAFAVQPSLPRAAFRGGELRRAGNTGLPREHLFGLWAAGRPCRCSEKQVHRGLLVYVRNLYKYSGFFICLEFFSSFYFKYRQQLLRHSSALAIHVFNKGWLSAVSMRKQLEEKRNVLENVLMCGSSPGGDGEPCFLLS